MSFVARGPLVFKANRPGNPRQVCSELGYVVSGWRSVIALLRNVGGGASLICTCLYSVPL